MRPDSNVRGLRNKEPSQLWVYGSVVFLYKANLEIINKRMKLKTPANGQDYLFRYPIWLR